MEGFSPTASIRFGWETFKKRPWFLIGAFLVTVLAGWFAGVLTGTLGEEGIQSFIGDILNWGLQTLIGMGMVAFLLKAHESVETVTLDELWHPKPFWSYLAASIIYGIGLFVGTILLIIPGIIVACTYVFGDYIVIDRNLGPIAALKESARITRGYRWKILGFFGLVILLNVAGALLLIVGLLVTIPVTSLGFIHAYRTLEHKASEVVPAAA